jgi:hypothetical protein
MSQSGGDQLELFSDPQEDPKRAVNRTQRNSFIAKIWGYEKVILFIILFFVTAVVSYSLGVEKGRRSPVSIIQPAAVIAEERLVVEAPRKIEPLAPAPASSNQGGNYTIQVASFKGSSYAKKEAELLNKRGFKAFVLNKGKYTILCVGRFPDKERAQPLLSELRKKYKSCYIRRL